MSGSDRGGRRPEGPPWGPPLAPAVQEAARRASHEELREALLRIGYDLEDNGDIRRLSQTLEWAERRREKEAQSGASWAKLSWILLTAVVGSVLTVAATWIRDRWPPSGH